jgi:hypothetical protein
MKTLIRLTPILVLLLATSIHQPRSHASDASSDRQQKENPFVGVWEPAPNQGQVFVKSLWIDEDGTFAMEASGDRKDLKGTYTIKDGKLWLEAEELKKRHEGYFASIISDGRLKLTKSDEEMQEGASLYFVKK